MTAIDIPDAVEKTVMVLRPGDIILLRNKRVMLTVDEIKSVQARFAESGVTALVLGSDWDVVREAETPAQPDKHAEVLGEQ